MALATVAAVAGLGSAAYLDARYNITGDIKLIRGIKKTQQLWEQAAAAKRASLYYLWEDSVLARGNDECIWSREGCYTWTQSYDRVNQYAQWYLSKGVKPKDLVAFYLTNSPDFIFAWFGLWAIGAAPAMINHNLEGKALLHCLKISDARILLVDHDPVLAARIQNSSKEIEEELGIKIISLDKGRKKEIFSFPALRPGNEYRDDVKGDEPMCLLYTSGTTGLPKGCAYNVDRMFQRAVGLAHVRPDDRWYDCMPMYHGTGGCIAVNQLLTGLTLCIGKKFSTTNFWKDCIDSRANWIVYVGETARYLLAAPPSPNDRKHSVRGMYGNGLRPDVWTKFRDRFGIEEILEFFNSTEGIFQLSNYCKGDYLAAAVGRHGLLLRQYFNKTYIPVRVDPATGDLTRDPKTGFCIREPYDVGGEMIVAVPSEKAFQGYHNNDAATKKKFARDVFQKGDLWYRSGDALRRTDDGRWFFLDRLGDTFRWKGENVSTAEVAEALGHFPGVVEANVYGVQLPGHDGRAGCAAIYVAPADRDNFDFAGLLRHAQKLLPKYAVPIFIRMVEEMTPIHNNKQNKVPLREEGVDPKKVKNGDYLHWTFVGTETYHPFTHDHWEDLHLGKARL